MKRKTNLRRIASLLLSLCLLLTATPVALAYEDTEPPVWEGMGYSSLEELLEEWGFTEEEYYEYLVRPTLERAEEEARVQGWLDAHPAEAAAFDPYAYFTENFGEWYESPEEYMALDEFDEEAFSGEMMALWVLEQILLESQTALMAAEKVARGGAADGLNVMVNGRCVPYQGARPELKQNRTMVPLGATMEYLGGKASYDPDTNTVSIYKDATDSAPLLTHVVGSQTLTPSEVEEVEMDVPSYLKNGVVMMPVAYLGRCLGYAVLWDGDYDTTVLADVQSAAAEMDSGFTLLNRALYAASYAELYARGKPLSAAVDMKLDITLLDSLWGDRDYAMSMEGDGLSDETAASLRYAMDMGGLFQLLLELSQSDYGLTEEELAEFALVQDMLGEVELEMIVDLEGQEAYLRSPLLSELGLVSDSQTWGALSLAELTGSELSALYAAQGEAPATVGGLLAASFSESAQPFLAWDVFTGAAEEMAALVGDDCFVQSDGSHTLRWEMAQLGLDMLAPEEGFDCAMTITPVGEKSCRYSFTISVSGREAVMNFSLHGSSDGLDLSADVHIKNTLKAALTLKAEYAVSNGEVPAAPPAGDAVERLDTAPSVQIVPIT